MLSLNKENFDKTIADSKITLVDFWAEWCGPCRMLLPLVEEIATEFEGKANITKLNVDEAPEIAGKFNIRSIPTLILFKNGEVIETINGAKSKAEIVEILNNKI